MLAVADKPAECAEAPEATPLSAVVYKWTLADGPAQIDIGEQRSSSSSIFFAPHSLPPGSYEFHVSAHLSDSPAVNNSASVSVSVGMPGLEVWIRGAGTVACTGGETVLEAMTIDRTPAPGSGSNHSYRWHCTAFSPTGQEVACEASSPNSSLIVYHAVPAIYIYTVVVTSTHSGFVRNASAATRLHVTAVNCSGNEVYFGAPRGPLPTALKVPGQFRSETVFAQGGTVLDSERLSLLGRSLHDGWKHDSIVWHSDLLDLSSAANTVTGRAEDWLIVAAGAMRPGRRYKFFFLASTGNHSTYSELFVETYHAPCCGGL